MTITSFSRMLSSVSSGGVFCIWRNIIVKKEKSVARHECVLVLGSVFTDIRIDAGCGALWGWKKRTRSSCAARTSARPELVVGIHCYTATMQALLTLVLADAPRSEQTGWRVFHRSWEASAPPFLRPCQIMALLCRKRMPK